MRPFRFVPVVLAPALALAVTLGLSGPVLAAGSSVPFDYKPDPALMTASRGELEARIRRACVVVQARQRGVAETALNKPCSCYARRTLRDFTLAELQAYRQTGVFNETGRVKAQAALAACLAR